MEDFERELKNTFLEEATQLLEDVEQCFLELEQRPGDCGIIEKVFRLAHNIKGSANGVGFGDVGEFTHELESLLLLIKKNEISLTPTLVNLLLQSTDHIRVMINGLRADIAARFDSSSLIRVIKDVIATKGLSGDVLEDTPGSSTPAGDASDLPSAEHGGFFDDDEPAQDPDQTLGSTKESADIHGSLDEVPSDADEASNVISLAPVAEPKPAAAAVAKSSTKGDDSIRVSFSRVEQLLNAVGELVILEAVIKEQVGSQAAHNVKKVIDQMGKVTKEVQDLSMSLRMMPIKPMFQKMQRVVRDTASGLGKKIEFIMEGAEAELDKTLLEQINDPLVHLVRNAVDHGIEGAAARREGNKPEQGTIRLSAYRRGDKMIFEVKDDGGGLDAKKILKSAKEKGIVKADAEPSERDCWNLIFAPGFSTKLEVTDVSGRGVGMDVVKTNVEALSGSIQIESELGKGSCFRIHLPLTLAIIDGMVIRADGHRYVIPLSHVHETVRTSAFGIQQTTGIGSVLMLRGENLPLYGLGQLISRGRNKQVTSETAPIAIVVRSGPIPYAIAVEDIIGRQQVVSKQLGKELQHMRGLSGSTILGDGKPALILEIDDLIADVIRRVA